MTLFRIPKLLVSMTSHRWVWFGALLAMLVAPACGGSDGSGGDAADNVDTTQPEDDGAGESLPEDDTSSEGGDDAEGGGPDTFVPPQCAIPEGQQCSGLCNTGCSDTQGCIFLGKKWECVTKGEVGPGGACENPQDCAMGVCASSEEDEPICLAPCLDNDDCKDQGLADAVCNLSIPGALPYKFCGDAPPPPPPCDLFADQPCEAEGQGCYIGQNGPVCTNAGSKGVGESCTSGTQCSPGHTCINVAGTSGCVRICNTAGGAKSCAAVCGAGNSTNLNNQPGVGYCSDDIQLPVCTPLNPSCSGNQGCFFMDGGWYCAPAGVKELNESCSGATQCQAGLICHISKCRTICDSAVSPNNPKCSTPAIPCVPVGGGTGVGFCDQ